MDFPGCPVIKTSSSSSGVEGSKPGQGTRSHMLQLRPGDVCMLLCPTLCDPIDCTPTRLLCPWDSSGKLQWSGLPFPSLEDLPDPGIETASPALKVGSSPLSPQGSPQVRILGHCCSVKTVVSLITTSWRSKTEEMSFQWEGKEAGQGEDRHSGRAVWLQTTHFSLDLSFLIYGMKDGLGRRAESGDWWLWQPYIQRQLLWRPTGRKVHLAQATAHALPRSRNLKSPHPQAEN